MEVKHQCIQVQRKPVVIIAVLVVLIAMVGGIYKHYNSKCSSFLVDLGTIMSGDKKEFSFDIPQRYLEGKIGHDRIIISNCSCVVIRSVKPSGSKGLHFNCQYRSNNKVGTSYLKIITLSKNASRRDVVVIAEIAVKELAPFSLAHDRLSLSNKNTASQVKISLNRNVSKTKTMLTIAEISPNLIGYIRDHGDYALLTVHSKEQASAITLGYITVRDTNGFAKTIYVNKGNDHVKIAESKSMFIHDGSLVVDEILLSTDKTRLKDIAYSVTPNLLSVHPVRLIGRSCLVKIDIKKPLKESSRKFFIQEIKQVQAKRCKQVTELSVIRL